MFKQAKKMLIPYNTQPDTSAIASSPSPSPSRSASACRVFGAGKKLIETHARMKPDRAVSAKSSGLCGTKIRETINITLWHFMEGRTLWKLQKEFV